MRRNEPVTQREYEIPEGSTLMSTTDPQSHLQYANEAFVSASGFSLEELQGQPHNIVRHPDMPPEAFADMWATLKAGEPWSALVKNRRKNGDHYWVRANAVPVVRQGQHAGYMSVRTKPGRDEVAAAEELYRDLREGRARGRVLKKGILVNTGWRALFSLHKTMGLKSRVRLNFAVLWLAACGVSTFVEPSLVSFAEHAMGAGLFFALASLLLESQVVRPILAMSKTAMDVATGASREVTYMDRTDEIGMASRAVSQVGLMFRWLVDDVSQQVMSVQNAVSEIAQGNDDLSVRTERAASSVQETASSMTEMTEAVRTSADAAAQANQLSGAAKEAASKGGSVVNEVVSTMSVITDSAKRISDIISVIDGIAFQTNILALNAAVEAARAGEQGRGFAVVAGEVRTLAQRSASAAREIKSPIGASVDNVESGSKLVDEAGRAMQEILTQVHRTTDLIGEITHSARQQSAGITQVNQSVGHLDEITQQNAALVEQNAAASASLRQQAERLVEAVGVFR